MGDHQWHFKSLLKVQCDARLACSRRSVSKRDEAEINKHNEAEIKRRIRPGAWDEGEREDL